MFFFLKRIFLFLCFIISIDIYCQSQTLTFNYTGDTQTWDIPSCVNSINVTLAGASGGGSSSGAGAVLNGIINVTPGQTLFINVGGQGSLNSGGFNGGGNSISANNNENSSYGGGGASDIRTSNNLNDRLIVAAGGGGTGGGNTDAVGGWGGCDFGNGGYSPFGQGGGGANLNNGGAGGPPWINSGNYGLPGSLGFGGDGATDPCYNLGPGGGGGGGYYGGGGGGSDCFSSGSLGGGGGGGGSSLIPENVACTQNSNEGNGYVIIEYTLIQNFVTDIQSHCNSYTWIDGNTYTGNNNSATFITIDNNCEIISTLDLTILNTTYGTDIQSHCNSYTWIDGNTYTSNNNSAIYTLTNSNGCDSIVTLDLTILNTTYGIDIQSHCNSYTWIDGNTYNNNNNSANFTLTNSNGCDSVVTLDLTILNTTYGTDIQSHCNSYTWIDGNIYNSNNNSANFTLTNSNGCDSIVTLDLTILNTTYGIDIQNHCSSYTWIDGNTYTSNNNSANCTITNSNGCDSIVTLDLTILNTTYGTDIQSHCNSYTWIDGNTYNSNNNSAIFVLTNSIGCDSIVTLDLTILNTTYGIDIQSHCNSYTWIDGNTYTSNNNSANCILTNSNGCDSIVTLDLTILNTTYGTDIQSHCDSYTWIDGNTYNSNNNSANFTLTNSNGCDSVVTLDLTVLNTTYGTDIQNHCDSYTWIDGNTYNSNNNSANFTLTNSNGCDSVVTLDLSIENATFGIDSQVQCKTYTWIDGITYTTNNNSALFVLTNSIGCDSIVTLNLTIINEPSFEIVYDQNWCEKDSIKEVIINNYGIPPFEYSIEKNQEVIEDFYTTNFSDVITINNYGMYYLTNYQDDICNTDSTAKINLIFRPSPHADFTTIPQATDLNNPEIFFRNISTPNCFSTWSFGDEFGSEDFNFNTHYSYIDTGIYIINLNIENQYGCVDSTSREVTIYPPFDIFIPSAFSPNSDGINDIFKPTLYGTTSFKMTITNRWGMLIYSTDDKNKGWNGISSNKSDSFMSGNYTYRIDVTDYFGKKYYYVGNVLLIN